MNNFFAELKRRNVFKRLVKFTGLEDYWRLRGWPEFGRPLGNSDFECD